MGEAGRRAELGIVPQSIKQGQQVQVDLSNAEEQQCECGCKYFEIVHILYHVSALVSPIGRDMIASKQAFLCSNCKKEFEQVKPTAE
jgi:hypothetical protein